MRNIRYLYIGQVRKIAKQEDPAAEPYTILTPIRFTEGATGLLSPRPAPKKAIKSKIFPDEDHIIDGIGRLMYTGLTSCYILEGHFIQG